MNKKSSSIEFDIQFLNHYSYIYSKLKKFVIKIKIKERRIYEDIFSYRNSYLLSKKYFDSIRNIIYHI